VCVCVCVVCVYVCVCACVRVCERERASVPMRESACMYASHRVHLYRIHSPATHVNAQCVQNIVSFIGFFCKRDLQC